MGIFKDHPELSIFACIAAGYLVGKLRVGPVSLGGICGVLICSLILGTQHVTVNDDVKTVFFAIFIFSLGYMAGPQFFANLNRKSLRYFALCGIEVVCVLGIAFGAAKMFNLDVGTASGILAGAATESALVGTSTEAIGKLSGLTPQQISTYQSHVATAYTVCYLFGLITIVLYTSQFMPMIMRINLRSASRRLEEQQAGDIETIDAGEEQALPEQVGRTYEVVGAAGSTVAQLEGRYGNRITVETVKRGDDIESPPKPGTALSAGDQVLVVGRRERVIEAGDAIGTETAGIPGFDLKLTTTQVAVTQKDADRQSIDSLQKANPDLLKGGVYVTGIDRIDQHLPADGHTIVHRGDILTLTGPKAAVQKVVALIGTAVRNKATDYVYLGIGIALGSLLGQISVKAGSASLSFGTGGGCLISGLVLGWYRSRTQSFGAFPAQAATTLKDLGLAVFIACTGLSAGTQAWPLLKQYGALLPVSGILMVLVPATISLFVGWKLLKLQPPLLIGAIAGQQCSTPAITAVTQTAQSSVPMLGYTITYALSNFLLPLTGPVLVGILGS
ncbi:aspartate-alanine antiporter [Mangrovactinospora gilvigrisea]|uniref:Aspartate-alanine antiporter n=1 Tax=Mangrovactinospora gilvigrisea TaxID=1428644 RepID=A0A1J7BGU1_9ACTN|nr:aspartate-alanine antiporter [Mangrovactinospora gilvigrisea]OIV37907.1 aspartate-alanine antiporter [Mangrovactinospora gilvigrisea]